MTEMKDPVRLRLGGSPAAQDLLRAAHADLPTRVQLDRLAGRLAPTVAAPAASGLLLKIAVGIAVLGAAGIVLWTRDREPSPSPIVTTAPVVAPAELPAPPPAPPAPVEVAAPTSLPATPAVVIAEQPRREPVRTQPKKSVEPAAVEQLPPPREMDLLDPAHAALRMGNVKQALELATRHAELYANGVMTEEREAIAIESLHRLGRDEARIRFTKFIERFPRSGYRARLERIVGEPKR